MSRRMASIGFVAREAIGEILSLGEHARYSAQMISSPELENYFFNQAKYIVLPGLLEKKIVFKGRNTPKNSTIFDYNTRQDIRKSAEEFSKFLYDNYWENPLRIIGCSLGGLVARYALQVICEKDYANELVTIATPHQGTYSAKTLSLIVPSCKQILPDSKFLDELNSHPLGRIQRGLSLRADVFDEIVFPFANAIWPSDDTRPIFNERVKGVNGHAKMLYSKEVWQKATEFFGSKNDNYETLTHDWI